MTSHRKQKRSIRATALTAFLIAALMLPAAALAGPLAGDPPAHGQVAAVPPASVVHQTRTISTGDGSRTLAIVLASTALGIAMGGSGYVAFRVRPLLRSSRSA